MYKVYCYSNLGVMYAKGLFIAATRVILSAPFRKNPKEQVKVTRHKQISGLTKIL